MSNPVVKVSNSIPEPSDPKTTRKSFMMKVFDAISFFLYGEGQTSSSFDPSDMGNEFYIWYRVGDEIAAAPDFVATGSWDGLFAAPSGFITPNYSVMPKLIGPSTLMVDNGVVTANSKYASVFNWVVDTVNGTAVGAADWFKYIQTGGFTGSRYVSVKAKDDAAAVTTVEMHLDCPTDPPTGNWDSGTLVGGGAFGLMLNILGVTSGQVTPDKSSGWSLVIKFGDVTMTIADASTMKVNIAGDGTKGNDTSVNLAEGAAKEGPPQQQHIADKAPILITAYPCWNGIVVTCGQQETPEVVKTASTFCRKMKSASIQDPTYCGHWFDPQSPNDVVILGGSDAPDVKVDFGSKIEVTATNCRFEIAYLPKFFTQKMKFDGWLLLADNSGEITYNYNVYTIYTENGADFTITTPAINDSGHTGTADNTSYWYIPWGMKSSEYLRWGGEVFAYILETSETRTSSIKNGNGGFNLGWTGGTPAGSGSWTKYIKSVTVTIGIDGSSGSILVDKYGVAGQGAIATQSIGAVVLSATGGQNTVGGSIFSGFGMGIGDAESNGDATWTIPLIGLEKKLEDIALINPPYLDGYTLGDAINYLCGYAGIIANMGYANSGVHLSATEEINAARFDWKSGTSVKTALDDVLEDVNHGYCVRDGVIYIYRRGDDGLPLSLGPDRSGGYSSTNIVMTDKTPDFESLRNYIVTMALQQVSAGMGTKIQQTPTFPMIVARTKSTTPDVPWAKCYVRVFSASLDETTLEGLADKISWATSTYQITGKLTIPGNASIKPFDQWGDQVIMSVTHNLDMAAKTWTTDLEFMRKAV